VDGGRHEEGLEDDLCGDAEMSKPSIGFLVAMAATLAPVAPAAAQQMETATPPGDRWTIEVAPYLWIASMDGNATVGGIKSDVDVPFSDLLKDLSGGLMTAVERRRDGRRPEPIHVQAAGAASSIGQISDPAPFARAGAGPYWRASAPPAWTLPRVVEEL
jgi:hypothetical protein